jgi:N-acetylneuraminic acid mutarotase
VCAYLNNQIYCYGGNQAPTVSLFIDPGLYALNLSKTQQLDQLDWEPIKVKNDFVPEERLQTQYAVISKGTQLLLEGGRNEVRYTTAIVNDTIIYDALENTWKSVPSSSQLIDTDAA